MAALVFLGFMGAGKSSAAREAAAALGTRAQDTDRMLEERFGCSIEDFFAREGEARFRAEEERLCVEVLAAAADGDVIALGGGAILAEGTRAALAPHTAILVEVDLETAWQRAGGRGRPLARDRRAFEALYAARRPLYRSVADAVLPRGDRVIVRRAAAILRAKPPDTTLLWATSAGGDYPVLIGRRALEIEPWPAPGRRLVISDTSVAGLHGHRTGAREITAAIAPGEEHKTLAMVERVQTTLLESGATRADHVVALGGGVVGDLAGFCAATYQRGIPVVHIPTTLVAMVDSAYGGKTGVDIAGGKNYVGAYHQPAAVLVDPSFLDTLPEAELAAGRAEVIKTALIAGGPLWELVRSGVFQTDEVLVECARTKLRVVAADERDGGLRQVLNLGHTVGHAIETVTEYQRFRHGEAVAVGLVAALRLSGREELLEEVRGLLERAGLPTSAPGVDADAVLRALRNDKKRLDGDVPFVLVHGPGDVRHGQRVEASALRAAVSELTT